MTIFLLIAAVLLVAFGGLMAAVDAALGVTSRQDFADWSHSGRNAKALRIIGDDVSAHANAVVFMRILAETTAAVMVTALFMLLLDHIGWSILAAALIMTAVSFVLVGASPRSVGRQHSTGLLRGTALIIRACRIAIGPLAHGLAALGDRVTPGVSRGASFTSEEQLLSMVDEAASHDLIEEDDRELIHSVFDFTDRFVRAVMVPRTEIVTIENDATTEDAVSLFLSSGVSRMPITEGDDVVGMLYLKDIIASTFADESGWRARPAIDLAREPVFVPEAMKAETLLQQMKRDSIHVCLVVDEYGGVSGLVTLEDLIEELVGDISDEHDAKGSEIIDLGDGRYRVSARLPLDEVGDLFGIELEDEDVDSIGGLLAKELGRVPESGSIAESDGIIMTGGESRGRRKGLANIIVERSASLKAAEEAFANENLESGDE
ncbi:hemolysin family protein [Microbacterium sp. YY-03]|uniref:hemolysin family protein n=1 Tax=Microbacterium sp. YY-03 TaxID=3421636 RepID=UPI003D165A8A